MNSASSSPLGALALVQLFSTVTYLGSVTEGECLSWFLHQCGQADSFSLVGRRAHALPRGQ